MATVVGAPFNWNWLVGAIVRGAVEQCSNREHVELSPGKYIYIGTVIRIWSGDCASINSRRVVPVPLSALSTASEV